MPSEIHAFVSVLLIVSILAAVGTMDYDMQIQHESINVSADDLDPDLVKQVNNYMRLAE